MASSKPCCHSSRPVKLITITVPPGVMPGIREVASDYGRLGPNPPAVYPPLEGSTDMGLEFSGYSIPPYPRWPGRDEFEMNALTTDGFRNILDTLAFI
jgi:hypothetical protein